MTTNASSHTIDLLSVEGVVVTTNLSGSAIMNLNQKPKYFIKNM